MLRPATIVDAPPSAAARTVTTCRVDERRRRPRHDDGHLDAVELGGHDRAERDDRVGLAEHDRRGRGARADRLGEHVRARARAAARRHHEHAPGERSPRAADGGRRSARRSSGSSPPQKLSGSSSTSDLARRRAGRERRRMRDRQPSPQTLRSRTRRPASRRVDALLERGERDVEPEVAGRVPRPLARVRHHRGRGALDDRRDVGAGVGDDRDARALAASAPSAPAASTSRPVFT